MRPVTVVIFVHDLESSVRFYSGLLAMEVTARDDHAAVLGVDAGPPPLRHGRTGGRRGCRQFGRGNDDRVEMYGVLPALRYCDAGQDGSRDAR